MSDMDLKAYAGTLESMKFRDTDYTTEPKEN